MAESEEIKEYGFVVGRVEHGKVCGRKPGKKAARPLVIALGDGTRREFEYRVDESDGRFIAVSEDGADYWSATSKKALTIKLAEVVKNDVTVEWTRYIDVDYTAYTDDHWHSNYDLDDERDSDRAVVGIRLSLKVVEYSNPMPNKREFQRRCRTVVERESGDDGPDRFTQSEWRSGDLPPGLLPYTPERLATLRKVQEAIASADRAMLALLSGSPEQLAAKVDTRAHWLEASGAAMPLLVAPTDEAPKPDPRRKKKA